LPLLLCWVRPRLQKPPKDVASDSIAGLMAAVVPMVDRSWPSRDRSWLFRGRSWLFRGRPWLAYFIRAEVGGTAVAIGGTAIPGAVGGVTAEPTGASGIPL
jgi:hypothetical protein